MPVAILFGLVVGMAAGFFNSIFITFLDLHPLVVTLGTFALFQGLAYGLTGARAVSDFLPGSPTSARRTCSARCRPAHYLPGRRGVVWLILSRTSFGRYVYAIGNNEEAARFSGVPIRRVKVAIYTGIGLLVAIASVIYTSRVYTARGDVGLGLELDVISAVVLGGRASTAARGP